MSYYEYLPLNNSAEESVIGVFSSASRFALELGSSSAHER